MTFDQWCDKVDEIFSAEPYDWDGSYTREFGRGCFLKSYNEGETPEDEVATQVSYFDEKEDDYPTLGSLP